MRMLRSALGAAVLVVLAACTTLGPLALDPAWEIGRGNFRGEPIDAALIARLAAAGDDPSLALLARNVRVPGLRAQAARSLVRLRIARSPFAEVQEAPAAVEETVLRLGVNPVAPALHPPRAARLELAHPELLVAQRWTSAALLVRAAEGSGATAALPLRGPLQVELAGVSRPVTVCGPADALDPAPCLSPAEVRSDAAIARVDEQGVVRFAEALDPAEVAAWAGEARLSIPLRIGGGPVVALEGSLRFLSPGALVLTGRAPGADGPDLRIAAVRAGDRLTIAVEGAGRTHWAVLERQDAPAARIVSRGAAGSAGAPGSWGATGMSGSSGSSASCPPFAEAAEAGGSGQAGSAGGPGGPGGPGGRGGTIDVVVSAPEALRAETLRLLRAMVASEGGAGGAGGSGGRGGSGGTGGMGGSGTTCFRDERSWSVPSAPDGAPGTDGPDGPDGAPGAAGAPGAVRFPADG